MFGNAEHTGVHLPVDPQFEARALRGSGISGNSGRSHREAVDPPRLIDLGMKDGQHCRDTKDTGLHPLPHGKWHRRSLAGSRRDNRTSPGARTTKHSTHGGVLEIAPDVIRRLVVPRHFVMPVDVDTGRK